MQKCGIVALVACLLLLLAGCSSDGLDDEGMGGVVCTTEARSSVVVRVVDATGAPLPGALVTYRVDGGPTQAAECFESQGSCTRFSAGFEVAGDFTIRAERSGFRPATASLRVERDAAGCHVLTQEIVLLLVPAETAR